MAMHEAWLVDLDGTLYRALPVKIAMGMELLLGGLRVAPTLRSFRKHHELLRHNGTVATDPYRVQLETTARAVGRDVEAVERDVVEWMHRRPGRWIRIFRRRELLAEIVAFRARKGRTAVVSDYPASAKLEALGARDLFDVVVASGEPGGPTRLKPDPEGYLAAAQRLGVPAERCLVIGDRPDADGRAATAAKMTFRRIS